MSKRDELIFWFDQPPKVSLGAFNHVASHWGNKVIYVVDHPLGAHRKMINWDNTDFGDAEVFLLSEQENEQSFIEEMFRQHPNAVHILNGFFSTMERKIRPYIQKKGIKLAVHTEMPTVFQNPESYAQWRKRLLLPIKYRKTQHVYGKYAKAVIPLGHLGKRFFERCGWEKNRVFSFMYCPVLQEITVDNHSSADTVRFLYVGRFNNNRVDILMKAINMLEEKNWHLDIVGGYGDMTEQTLAWSEQHPNVSYLGLWPADEVGKNMQNYDVYLLASKCDGWNAQLNEVINAGLGVITTTAAISDEMVSAADAGLVVKPGDAKAFRNAMQFAINNPQEVCRWKENAANYRHRIAGAVVGDYFMDILDYTFYDKKERPHCPWL